MKSDSFWIIFVSTVRPIDSNGAGFPSSFGGRSLSPVSVPVNVGVATHVSRNYLMQRLRQFCAGGATFHLSLIAQTQHYRRISVPLRLNGPMSAAKRLQPKGLGGRRNVFGTVTEVLRSFGHFQECGQQRRAYTKIFSVNAVATAVAPADASGAHLVSVLFRTIVLLPSATSRSATVAPIAPMPITEQSASKICFDF